VKNGMKVILKPDKNGNYITTTAIGEPYFSDFTKYSMPSWVEYCNRFGLGLAVVVKDLIDVNDKYYKKANWQKFLVGKELQIVDDSVNNICHLDTDIIISPIAPNIFEFHNNDKISVISKRKNLPFSYDLTLRKIAFFRNKYYDQKYPLDSALFISIDDLYKYHDLKVPKIADETCSGVYVFNVKKYSDFFEEIFYSYTHDIDTITNGGDQTHFNYHVLNNEVNFLSYKFQAIWVFEQAIKYPFLYDNPGSNLIKQCIESALLDNYFLHFAGSWHESDMWKMGGVFDSKEKKIEIRDYYKYLKESVTGDSKGMIKP
jgi:hypothetical protein